MKAGFRTNHRVLSASCGSSDFFATYSSFAIGADVKVS
jgi:hypothetical protein